MVDKSIEEKVKINNWFELSEAPMYSWVEIDRKNELKVAYNHPKGEISTLSVEEDYICKKYYNIFLGSLTPIYIEKFLKETGEGLAHLKIINGDNK